MLSFNLIDEPWLPVDAAGRRRAVSLREALVRAHEFDALSFEFPTQLPAVLRQVLLPVVLDIVGFPRDEAEWGERWRAGRFEEGALEAYFEAHHDRFDLFDGARPFAQVAGLRTTNDETKPSSLVIPPMASGNNVPLFSARTEGDPPALTPAEAAPWLLNAHCWDTAAIKSGAADDPEMRGGKTTGNPVGPLGQLGVVIPIGRSLFETLLLNTPIQPDGVRPGDRPQWCAPASGGAWSKRAPLGLLDLLTWQARRIRLIPVETTEGVRIREVVLTAGDRLLQVPEEEIHTAWNLVEKPKAGEAPRRPRRHRSGKAAWQGLEALLAVSRVEEEDRKVDTSKLLNQIGALGLDEIPADYPLNVSTVGVEYGNQSAVVENIVADTIPLPVTSLGNHIELRAFVRELASDAAELASAANILAADLRRASGGDPVPWDKGQRPEPAVVQALDPLVRRLLAGLSEHPNDVDHARQAWHKAARKVLLEIAEPLIASAPPTAFVGRTRDQGTRREWTYRTATAEQAFRRRLNQRLYLATPDRVEPPRVQWRLG